MSLEQERAASVEQENKAIRDEWFAAYWNNKLGYEELELSDGALLLQQMGLIPSVVEPGGEARTRTPSAPNWRARNLSPVG